VYNYAFRMTLDRDRAAEVVEETFLRTYVGQDKLPDAPLARAWIFRICQHVVEKKLPRSPEVSFDVLDDTLRSEATRTDVVRSLSDPQRDFMLWEMKQGCMTAVVNCLSPGERSAFSLAYIIKLPEEEAATILGVSKSAYKVRLSRAQKKITDYLAPRCEHIDPLNPCRCPARVGIALSKGFIRGSGSVKLRGKIEPFGRYGSGPDAEDAPLRDVRAVYGSLPDPDPPDDLQGTLEGRLESGEWDEVLAQKG
jgi:RNA polymerase sigma-70 factor (ECF subfamily)